MNAKDTERKAVRTGAPKRSKAKGKRDTTLTAIGPTFAGLAAEDAAALKELARLAKDAKDALSRLADFVHDSCDANVMLVSPNDATIIFALAGYVAQRTACAFAENAHAICKFIAKTDAARDAPTCQERGKGKA